MYNCWDLVEKLNFGGSFLASACIILFAVFYFASICVTYPKCISCWVISYLTLYFWSGKPNFIESDAIFLNLASAKSHQLISYSFIFSASHISQCCIFPISKFFSCVTNFQSINCFTWHLKNIVLSSGFKTRKIKCSKYLWFWRHFCNDIDLKYIMKFHDFCIVK